MGAAFKVELAALRQIGWDHWDPIDIRSLGTDDWQGAAADEYDRYLLHVAQLLKGGTAEPEAVEYLDQIASDHMGLGPITQEGHAASVRTVNAIAEHLRD